MQIIFDRDLETQTAINVTYFGENLTRNVLNAHMVQKLASVDVVVPDLRKMPRTFSSVEAVDGRISIPVQGVYNVVLDSAATYNSSTQEYSVSISLGYVNGQTA